MVEWITEHITLLIGGSGILVIVGKLIYITWKEVKEHLATRKAERANRVVQSQTIKIQVGGDFTLGGSLNVSSPDQFDPSKRTRVRYKPTPSEQAQTPRSYQIVAKPTPDEVLQYATVIRVASDEEVVKYDPKVRKLITAIQSMVKKGDLMLVAVAVQVASISIDTWLHALPHLTKDELTDLGQWVDYQVNNMDNLIHFQHDGDATSTSTQVGDGGTTAYTGMPDFFHALHDGIAAHTDGGGIV